MILNTLEEPIEIDAFDYLYVFLCVIFLGSATVFTQGSLENFGLSVNGGVESVIGKLLMFLLSVCLLTKYGFHPSQCFNRKITLIIIVWGILQYFVYRKFSTYPFVRLMNVYFAMVLIICYGEKLVYILDHIFVKLAIISVVLWSFLVLVPDVVEFFLSMSPIKGYGLVKGNSIFVFASGFQYEIVKRNIGFAWEPGRFGSIMAFAVFLNLIVNKMEVRNNKGFWILSVAILSSQSTTAYLAYLAVLVFFLYNRDRKYIVKLIPFVLLFAVLLLSLDFMGEKLQDLSVFNEEHQEDFERQLEYYSTQDNVLVPQRFDGLLLEGLNILHSPLIGNATDTYSYLEEMFGLKFSLSNGVLRIFANMGLFIGVLYYWLLIKSSKWMSNTYQYKGTMAFFLIFFMINISYSWIFEPIFLTFILYPFIVKELYNSDGYVEEKA